MVTSASDYLEFQAFLTSEKIRIDREKWFTGERIKNDPGQEFIFNWIKQNSQQFRNDWNESDCKSCMSAFDCGHTLRKKCQGFSERKYNVN